MHKDLVKITEEKFGVKIDLRYATSNNVCGEKLYKTSFCYLHKDAADAFLKAIAIAKNHNLKFKIFDAFRPIQVQKFMFDKFPDDGENGGFVSNPKTGSTPHCRGVAIDLTLIDQDGNQLEMGSDFDEFSDLAFHNCEKISAKAKENRRLLFDIMKDAGFDFYSKEWWHYQLFEPRKYEIIETDGLTFFD